MSDKKKDKVLVLDGGSLSRMAAVVQMAAMMHTPPPHVEITPPEPSPDGEIIGTFFAEKRGDTVSMMVNGPRYRGEAKTYKPNGKRECERRMRQMAKRAGNDDVLPRG